MATVEILDTPSYTLVYHEEGKIIHHTLKPPMEADDTRDKHKGKAISKWQRLLTVGTEVLVEHGATKWIGDNRALTKALPAADEEWIQNTWQRDAIARGWKYWALVVPESLVGQADMIKYVESLYEKGLRVTVHSTLEAAFEQLRSYD